MGTPPRALTCQPLPQPELVKAERDEAEGEGAPAAAAGGRAGACGGGVDGGVSGAGVACWGAPPPLADGSLGEKKLIWLGFRCRGMGRRRRMWRRGKGQRGND
jgi:hypothetical protein